MTKANPLLDKAGEQVVRFMGDVRTLGKVGELAEKIIAMAESGAWRRYRTAVGTDKWLECEFDYFLIGCDVDYNDVYRAIKWHKLGDTTRAMMDPDASAEKRRTLEEASAAYHAAGPETLAEKAARLHWVKKDGSARSPLSRRQQAKQAAGGKTFEEQTRERRQRRIKAARRRELDRLARETLAELDGDDERRYFLDVFAQRLTRKVGRPEGDREEWAKDIAELNGNTNALAERWGISRQQANERKRKVNTRNNLLRGSVKR
jgi:hypothetical protein